MKGSTHESQEKINEILSDMEKKTRKNIMILSLLLNTLMNWKNS